MRHNLTLTAYTPGEMGRRSQAGIERLNEAALRRKMREWAGLPPLDEGRRLSQTRGDVI